MYRHLLIVSIGIYLFTMGALAQTSGKAPTPVPISYQTVCVVLREQPMAEAAQRWQPALRQRLEEIDLALRAFAGNPLVTPDMLTGARLAAQMQSAEALKDYRSLVYMDSERSLLLSRARLTAQVSRLGGRVLNHIPFLNSFVVSMPTRRIPELLKVPGVAAVWYPPLLQPQLEVSTATLFAPAVWDEGYTAPTWAVAIMDTGVNHTHSALSARTWIIPNRTVPGLGSGIRAFHDNGRYSSDYNDDYTTARDLQGHGTRVAGVALANSATRKGVAPFAGYGVVLKAGYRTTNGGGSLNGADVLLALDWAAREAPLPPGVGLAGINCSFGASTGLDDDILSQAFDAFMYTYQIPVAIAAGNTGGPEKKLLSPAIAYNGIAVAASDDRDTLTRSDDVIAGFSGRGPTLGGRKKPDVTAPGVGIVTTTGSGSSFVSTSGTSVATPHVTGALALLHDMGIHDPLLLRAVLINSAEDRGSPGWDREWGWGYVDLRAAMQHVVNRQYATGSVRPAGMSGSVAYFRTRLPAGGKVTLVWHRRAGFSPYSGWTYLRALANLRLTLIDESTGNIIGISDSTIDNVQQVVVTRAYSRVLVRVEAVSAFDQYLDEPFALASSGVLVPINNR
ncbi:MAG: S8 family serine peptidase [Armatimonadota bacterium]|nr:S8 family serine peptidase [Armatimonadota bacterium]